MGSSENVGLNPGHIKNLDIVSQMARKRKWSFIKAFKGITKNKNLGINIVHKLLPRKLRENRKSKGNIVFKVERMAKRSAIHDKPPVFAWVN